MVSGFGVEGLAARQHGVISRGQALEAGFSSDQVTHRLISGAWERLNHHVFAVRGAPPTWERQLYAALPSRPTAYAAGRTAGHLLQFPDFRKGRPEIMVPFEGNARSPLASVVRSHYFDEVEVTNINGFLATSVAETTYTLTQRESTTTIERVIDDSLAAKKLKIEEFDPILDRLCLARFRGLPRLRRLVAARDAHGYKPPTSELERLLYDLLDTPEVPEVSRQLPIQYPGLRTVVDAYIAAWAMIVEGDGRRWHSREKDFEKDRARDNAAAAAGLVVVRFSYRMPRDDPHGCLGTLIDAGAWRRSI